MYCAYSSKLVHWYAYYIPQFKNYAICIPRVVRKDKITISVDHGLIEWLDVQIKQKRFCSRSHAFEYAFLRMKNESQKPTEQ